MNPPSKAERRAIALLDELKITKRPVPVENIASTLGAEVTFEAFDGDVSGMLYRAEDGTVIGVNSRQAETRQRFTIAHEIGHMLLHKGTPMFIDRLVRVNWRDGASDLEEMAANAFAAELLMPRAFVQEEIEKMVSNQQQVTPDGIISQLARTFRVSQQAMGYRLTNLGILDPYTVAG